MCNISVGNFTRLCTESRLLEVHLFDIDSGSECYSGSGEDIPANLRSLVVQSYDMPTNTGALTINVCFDDVA